MARRIEDLPHALEDDRLARDMEGRTPTVFLDYDGTLTPIVDRPEDAVISEGMREAVRNLAARLPVCVVSGRDRPVVQQLMGVDDLIVAGSHGFDIWSPAGGEIRREEGEDFRGLLEAVEARLRDELGPVEGALVEPKKSSVAVLYLLGALDLDRDDVVPMYLGDDITDEHAFEALSGKGIGIFVGRADDPETVGRTTSADYALHTFEEVERFLDTLA